MIGMDYENDPGAIDKVVSARLKYNLGPINLLGGVSTQPDSMERYGIGATIDLPMQFILGGIAGFWDDELGYAVNIGRFNRLGDFNGLPSFALNYLEVPATYKWTNFRIMWGGRGRHYIRPTFENPVFSGMIDLDMAMMLKELIKDNYRHFDTPLLFLRYDEYGTAALRINYLDAETNFKRFDANLSFNTGITILKKLQSTRLVATFDRMHNPRFGWQDNRYHFSVMGYLFGKVYSGYTFSTDFDKFNRFLLEFRVQADL